MANNPNLIMGPTSTAVGWNSNGTMIFDDTSTSTELVEEEIEVDDGTGNIQKIKVMKIKEKKTILRKKIKKEAPLPTKDYYILIYNSPKKLLDNLYGIIKYNGQRLLVTPETIGGREVMFKGVLNFINIDNNIEDKLYFHPEYVTITESYPEEQILFMLNYQGSKVFLKRNGTNNYKKKIKLTNERVKDRVKEFVFFFQRKNYVPMITEKTLTNKRCSEIYFQGFFDLAFSTFIELENYNCFSVVKPKTIKEMNYDMDEFSKLELEREKSALTTKIIKIDSSIDENNLDILPLSMFRELKKYKAHIFKDYFYIINHNAIARHEGNIPHDMKVTSEFKHYIDDAMETFIFETKPLWNWSYKKPFPIGEYYIIFFQGSKKYDNTTIFNYLVMNKQLLIEKTRDYHHMCVSKRNFCFGNANFDGNSPYATLRNMIKVLENPTRGPYLSTKIFKQNIKGKVWYKEQEKKIARKYESF